MFGRRRFAAARFWAAVGPSSRLPRLSRQKRTVVRFLVVVVVVVGLVFRPARASRAFTPFESRHTRRHRRRQSATRLLLQLALADDAAHLHVVPRPLGVETQQHIVFVVAVAVIVALSVWRVETKVAAAVTRGAALPLLAADARRDPGRAGTAEATAALAAAGGGNGNGT